MASTEEESVLFIDRTETVLKSTLPSQISKQKALIRQGGFANAESVSNSAEVQRCPFTEAVRSEVNVEIQGFRETTIASTETVVTDRVRTVYGRSLSGSTSSTGSDHKELQESSQQDTDDSPFGEASYVGADGDQKERKTSDSYFISQTYQINSSDKASRAVTAMSSVQFRSSKEFEVGLQGQSADADTDAAAQSLQFVDRSEEIISGEDPSRVASPKDKQVDITWYGIEQTPQVQSLEKIKSAREDVQQLIESAYMVSDISAVIDDNHLGPESTKSTSEMSSDTLPSQESQTEESTQQESNTVNVQPNQGLNMPSLTIPMKKPSDFPVELEHFERLTPERDSPPRLAYSPGMAIRNYALEELAEKKSRSTPERIEAAAKSLKFDEESSAVDLDKGSSVDDLVSLQSMSIPHLKKVDLSQSRSKQTESSLRTSTTKDIQMFKLTKVQKVTLPDDPQYLSETTVSHDPTEEMTQEEADESLDKLVDLESIQMGYRFHDIGMMQDSQGICNPAFDDSDEPEPYTQQLAAAEHGSPWLDSQDLARMEAHQFKPASLESSEALSAVLRCEEQETAAPDEKDSYSASEFSSQSLPGTTVTRENATTFAQDTASLFLASEEIPSQMSVATDSDSMATIQQEKTLKNYQADDVDMGFEIISLETDGIEKVELPADLRESVKSEFVLQEMEKPDIRKHPAEMEFVQTGHSFSSENTSHTVEFGIVEAENVTEVNKNLMDQQTEQLENIAQPGGQASLETVENDMRNVTLGGSLVVQETGGNSQTYDDFQHGEMKTKMMEYTDQSQETVETDRLTYDQYEQSDLRVRTLRDAGQIQETLGMDNMTFAQYEEGDVKMSLTGDTGHIQETLGSEDQTFAQYDQSDFRTRAMEDTGLVQVEKLAPPREEQVRVDTEVKGEVVQEVEVTRLTQSDQTVVKQRPVGPPVQVTRRFNVSPKFESVLKSQGATLKSETMTIDIYYDTLDFELTLADCWLRSHNSKWEFHCNFTKLLNDSTKTEYCEAEDTNLILAMLATVLKVPVPENPDVTVASFLHKSSLKEFVRYTTIRKTYVLKGMTIDLELPEYGCWVGSVTAQASCKERIHDAVSCINTFWRNTGVQALNLLGA